MPTEDNNPRNTRRTLLNLWRGRLRGRPPTLLALDIWRALRPHYEAEIEGQLSGQQGHLLVDAQDDQAWTILSSMRLDQWELLLTSLLDLLGTPVNKEELPRLISWIKNIKQATWQEGSSCSPIDFSLPVCIRRPSILVA